MSKPLRPRFVTVASLALLLTWPAGADAQRQIREESVGEAFTVLSPDEGSGNTIVFRGADGTFLVDTMADSISNDFLAALDRLGVDDVRYVANTHWHQNHLGGNDDLSSTAVVIGPGTLRTRLQSDQTLEFLVDQTFPALPAPFWPAVTFRDAVALHFNGERIEILHVRGHTDSDAIVVWPDARLAATGDLWTPTGWMVPDIDTGGSLTGVVAALTRLLDRLPEDATIVPGHGRPGTRDELARYVTVVEATLDYVRLATDAGRDLRQIIDEAPPEVADPLGGAAPRMIEAAYRGGG